VHGCAGLCIFAGAVGMLLLNDELAQQVSTARNAVGCGGAALALGVVLGLLIPRRVIRRRLGGVEGHGAAALPNAIPGPAATGEGLEFAASVTGALILVLGLLWVLLAGLAGSMESFRAMLTQRFMHPPWLTQAVLLGPVLVGLVLAGTVGTTVVVALLGWHRLVSRDGRGPVRLWLTMIVAALIGTVAVVGVPKHRVLIILDLLAVFGAGILAVLRKPVGEGRSAAAEETPEHPAGLAASLIVVTAGSALAGVALVIGTPAEPVAISLAASGACALGGAALAGLLLGHASLRLLPRVDAALPLLLLAEAVVMGLLCRWTAAAEPLTRFWCPAGVVCVAVASIVLAGHAAASASGRVQPAVARVGASAAGGMAAGLLVASLWLTAQTLSPVVILSTLIATAVAGLVLVFQRPAPVALRAAGLAAIGVWLAVIVLGPGEVADTSRITRRDAPEPSEFTRVARRVLGLPQERVVQADSAATGPGPSAWQIDLGGPRWDVLILTSQPGEWSSSSPPSPRRALRLVRRCARSLLDGGRLVVELPAAGLARAAFEVFGIGADGRIRSEAMLLQVERGPEVYSAVVFGRDVSAWVDKLRPGEGFRITGRPLREPLELDEALE
jgi:hypothetical protein